jgi:transposase-like protein
MSLEELQRDKLFLENEQISIERKLAIVKKKINDKLPTMKDVQDRKRKAAQFDQEELEGFANHLRDTFKKPLNNQVNSNLDFMELEEEKYDEKINLPKTRKTYSEEIKSKAVDLVMKNGIAKVASTTGIGETCLKRWTNEHHDPSEKKKRGRKVKHPDIEEKILQFLKDKRIEEKVVTSKLLVKKARTFAKESNVSDINFSWGWLYKFMKRNHLSLRAPTTRVKKDLSILIPSAEAFIQKFQCYLKEGNFSIHYILFNFIRFLSSRLHIEFRRDHDYERSPY